MHTVEVTKREKNPYELRERGALKGKEGSIKIFSKRAFFSLSVFVKRWTVVTLESMRLLS